MPAVVAQQPRPHRRRKHPFDAELYAAARAVVQRRQPTTQPHGPEVEIGEGQSDLAGTLDRTGSHKEQPKRGIGGFMLRQHRLSEDRKSTRLNSSHQIISYAVFCLKKKTI